MNIILVVDDEYAIVDALASILEFEGYSVVTASNGREALERFYEKSPDLVLMDVMMPEMDGREALRAIRNNGKAATPVVLMSAGAPEVVANSLDGLDPSAFLRKPFEIDELLELIQKLLEVRSTSAPRS